MDPGDYTIRKNCDNYRRWSNVQATSLQGLLDENSWKLFKKVAFGSDTTNPPDDLVEIGQEIVDRCARVPLAIKVIRSLLFGQDNSKWELVRKIGLANIMVGENNNIMPILKMSCHHLEHPLKSFFSYCAIYPQDYAIEKETLKRLWMAQGYVVPRYAGQSIEDASEEYFCALLKRCFFQDILRGEAGEIWFVKIHDLMHDIAQSVSKHEIYTAATISDNLDINVYRHLSTYNNGKFSKYLVVENHLRSFLHADGELGDNNLEALVGSCR